MLSFPRGSGRLRREHAITAATAAAAPLERSAAVLKRARQPAHLDRPFGRDAANSADAARDITSAPKRLRRCSVEAHDSTIRFRKAERQGKRRRDAPAEGHPATVPSHAHREAKRLRGFDEIPDPHGMVAGDSDSEAGWYLPEHRDGRRLGGGGMLPPPRQYDVTANTDMPPNVIRELHAARLEHMERYHRNRVGGGLASSPRGAAWPAAAAAAAATTATAKPREHSSQGYGTNVRLRKRAPPPMADGAHDDHSDDHSGTSVSAHRSRVLSARSTSARAAADPMALEPSRSAEAPRAVATTLLLNQLHHERMLRSPRMGGGGRM
mmetsp:Transcript_25219/g.65835  ORF Transcript_25219/g.65835 Transcript_25219/m.65835 type:complete len:324 (-) Transcript_25219:21-992(-)